MPLKMNKSPLWVYEALYVFTIIAGEDSYEKIKNDCLAVLPEKNKEINEYFDFAILAVNIAKETVDLENETFKFLFKIIPSTEYSPAYLLLDLTAEAARDFVDKDKLESLHPKLFMKNTLKWLVYGDSAEKNEELPVSDDIREFFKILQSYGMDDEIQYILFKIYTRLDEYVNYVASLLNQMITALKKHEHELIKSIEYFCSITQEEAYKFLLEDVGAKIDTGLDIPVYPMISVPNTLRIDLEIEDGELLILWGVYIIDITRMIRNSKPDISGIQSKLHLITDKTKLDILILISQKPRYGAELTKELKLTGATISYHMGKLISAEAVKVETRDNKIYYELNEKYLAELIKRFAGAMGVSL